MVTRSDLPRGTQAAQLIHAAGHSAGEHLPDGTYAIALSCRNEAELEALSKRLESSGISHERIKEPDAPYFGQLMALGLRPAYKSKFKKFLSNLPLIK